MPTVIGSRITGTRTLRAAAGFRPLPVAIGCGPLRTSRPIAIQCGHLPTAPSIANRCGLVPVPLPIAILYDSLPTAICGRSQPRPKQFKVRRIDNKKRNCPPFESLEKKPVLCGTGPVSMNNSNYAVGLRNLIVKRSLSPIALYLSASLSPFMSRGGSAQTPSA